MLFRFFDFLFMFILTRHFSKTLWKSYHFLIQISQFISRCSILQNITMSILVVLQWRHFEYKAAFEKNVSFT